MRHESKKRAADLRKYRKERDEFLAVYTDCMYPGCGAPGPILHHARGRVGPLLRDQRWWRSSCHAHNMEAEDDTGKSRRVGWLLSQVTIPVDTAGEHMYGAVTGKIGENMTPETHRPSVAGENK